MEFHSPSEKIKLMRKRFRVNQAELEGVNMTRAFISMMESGKRNVSKASSKLLAEKFNKIASRISVNLNLDDEYFSRTPKEDAIYYCEEELKKELDHDKLKELIKVASDFKLDELSAKVYELDGDKYYKEENFREAFFAFRKALGKYKEIRDNKAQIKVYHLLGNCMARREEYEEAANYFQEAISYALDKRDIERYYKVSVNLAVAYMEAKSFDKSLDVLDNFIFNKRDEVDPEVLINALITKGNVYYWLEDYEKAIEQYLELAKVAENRNEFKLSIAYNNLAECYYKIGDYDKSIKYVEEAQRIKMRICRQSLPQTLNTKGKILFKKGFYNESILILNLAIDISEEYKKFRYLLDNCKDLVRVYESRKDYDSIRDLMNRLLNTVDYYGINHGKSYAVLKLAEISAVENNKSETMNLLNRLEALL